MNEENMTCSAYTGFAAVYDRFMDNVPYAAWAERLARLIRMYAPAADGEAFSGGGRLRAADIGCGTGTITEMLAQAGFAMTGVDLSPDMLALAQRRADETGSDTLYLCQDMRWLDPGEPFPAMVSVCDSVNYLLTEDDLGAALRSVRQALVPGGVFIFDFLTPARYRQIGDTVIAESREDCAFIWENSWDEETGLNEYALTLFAAADGPGEKTAGPALFRRSFEVHVQRGRTPDEMLAAAGRAGLVPEMMIDAEAEGTDPASDVSSPVTPDTERVLMVLRRPTGPLRT